MPVLQARSDSGSTATVALDHCIELGVTEEEASAVAAAVSLHSYMHAESFLEANPIRLVF